MMPSTLRIPPEKKVAAMMPSTLEIPSEKSGCNEAFPSHARGKKVAARMPSTLRRPGPGKPKEAQRLRATMPPPPHLSLAATVTPFFAFFGLGPARFLSFNRCREP